MRDRDSRLRNVQRFYGILAELERRVGGARMLATAHGRMQRLLCRMGWPQQGPLLFRQPWGVVW